MIFTKIQSAFTSHMSHPWKKIHRNSSIRFELYRGQTNRHAKITSLEDVINSTNSRLELHVCVYIELRYTTQHAAVLIIFTLILLTRQSSLNVFWIITPPTLIGRVLSDAFVWRLYVAYIEPKSRIDRPRKTKIGTEIAHVTRDWDTTFKVKVQGHQAALLSAALTRKSATVVSVGTCSVWESTAMLRLIGGAGGAWAPTGGGQGRGHIVSHAHNLLLLRS